MDSVVDILTASPGITHVRIWTTLSELEHQRKLGNQRWKFASLNQTLIDSMDGKLVGAETTCYPIFNEVYEGVTLLPRVFPVVFTADYGTLEICCIFDAFHAVVHEEDGAIRLSSLPEKYQRSLHVFADAFTSWLQCQHFRQSEIYALGKTSELAARLINQRPSSSQQDAMDVAVIFVDRTFDLVGPCSHPDHLLDTLVDLESTLGEAAAEVIREGVHGCRARWNNDTRDSMALGLDVLMSPNTKEGLVVIRKYLLDLIQDNELDVKVPKILGKVTANQLTKLFQGIKDNPGVWRLRMSEMECVAVVIELLKNMYDAPLLYS